MTLTAVLHPDVHLAWREHDIVILNIAADSYSCLVGAGPRLTPLLGSDGVRLTDPDLYSTLSNAGFFLERPMGPRPEIPAAARTLDLRPNPNIALKGAAALNAALSTAAFRRKTFAEAINTVRRRNARTSRPDLLSVSSAVAAFEAVLPWMPWEGECLQRAYVLHSHLHQCGLRADWIFGVRTWPFLAHCWLQIGDIVVGDTVDRVTGFSPILRV